MVRKKPGLIWSTKWPEYVSNVTGGTMAERAVWSPAVPDPVTLNVRLSGPRWLSWSPVHVRLTPSVVQPLPSVKKPAGTLTLWKMDAPLSSVMLIFVRWTAARPGSRVLGRGLLLTQLGGTV